MLYYWIGFITGVIWVLLIRKFFGTKYSKVGMIQIDDITGLARLKMTNGNLNDRKIKNAMFEVQHDVIIDENMREEILKDIDTQISK